MNSYHEMILCIEKLTSDDREILKICAPNSDGPPDMEIFCQGEWTQWLPRMIEGPNLRECLRLACIEKVKFEYSQR